MARRVGGLAFPWGGPLPVVLSGRQGIFSSLGIVPLRLETRTRGCLRECSLARRSKLIFWLVLLWLGTRPSGRPRRCSLVRRPRHRGPRIRPFGFRRGAHRLCLPGRLPGFALPHLPTGKGGRAVPQRLLARGVTRRVILAGGHLRRTQLLAGGGVPRRFAKERFAKGQFAKGQFAKNLPRNICHCPPGLAAWGDARHHRPDHQDDGERDHHHAHLPKRGPFFEHPPPFLQTQSAAAPK